MILKYFRARRSLLRQLKNQCTSIDMHIALQHKLQKRINELEAEKSLKDTIREIVEKGGGK